MHLGILLMAVGLAVLVRMGWVKSTQNWAERWQQALAAFLFPPLLLILTSLSVLGMGHHGTMLWQPVGWIGCHVALGFLAVAAVWLIYLLWQGWRSFQQVQSYPLMTIVGQTGRFLDTPALFAAQVGIWKPELVVSQGLLQSLELEQIEAVLTHEEAHAHYQDTFCFFGLSWLRQLTFWLPQTEALWQELLLLRELRADHWAAQRVDALVLAESLLLVTQSSSGKLDHHCAAFNDTLSPTRLEERIEALLSEQQVNHEVKRQSWVWLLLLLLPILIVPFHII